MRQAVDVMCIFNFRVQKKKKKKKCNKTSLTCSSDGHEYIGMALLL